MERVLNRTAPDFVGMLTPVRSAHSSWAALKYLASALYPASIPRWQRTQQLWGMLRTLAARKHV